MKLIYPYFRKNALKIIVGILCMIIVDAAQLIIPQITKDAIDTLNNATFEQSRLVYQCLYIVLLGLGMALLRYCWRNLLMGSARDVERGIREDLFDHVLKMDMAFYDRVKTGDIMAHATSDINHVRMAFGFGLIALVDTILLGGTTLAIMFWTHPKLTAMAMIPMPFLVYVTRTLGRKMHLHHTTAQASFSKLTEIVRESFFGIRIIKVFNFETIISEKVAASSKDYFRKNLKRAVITALLRPMLGLFFNLSTLVILFYGGYLVMAQALTAGELVAFLQYLGLLAWPVIAIGWMTNLYQRGMASLERINALLDARPGVAGPDNPVRPEKLLGRIRFENVAYAYGRGRPVLKDIHLDIPPGSTIGISGPPGSGKTSLVQMIPRLYDADSGQIWLDDNRIETFDLEFLRAHIALMPQESFLFSGTIRENILMGRTLPDAALDRMIRVCCLDQTLQMMADGLETMVGERGITLSGGQKQRIALARTLIVEKPIIILDDPISQMDTDTASKVMARLGRMNLAATVIIISHRISALAFCDRIYILKNGTIEHAGTHADLIERNPFYRQSYQVQQFEGARHA